MDVCRKLRLAVSCCRATGRMERKTAMKLSVCRAVGLAVRAGTVHPAPRCPGSMHTAATLCSHAHSPPRSRRGWRWEEGRGEDGGGARMRRCASSCVFSIVFVYPHGDEGDYSGSWDTRPEHTCHPVFNVSGKRLRLDVLVRASWYLFTTHSRTRRQVGYCAVSCHSLYKLYQIHEPYPAGNEGLTLYSLPVPARQSGSVNGDHSNTMEYPRGQ